MGYLTGMCFAMFVIQIFIDPCDNMVLEGSLHNLMEEVGHEEFMDISPRETVGKGLEKVNVRI
jgi:hypothetical protein